MASVDSLKKRIDDALRRIEQQQRTKQAAPLLIVRDGTSDEEVEQALLTGQNTRNVTIVKA